MQPYQAAAIRLVTVPGDPICASAAPRRQTKVDCVIKIFRRTHNRFSFLSSKHGGVLHVDLSIFRGW